MLLPPDLAAQYAGQVAPDRVGWQRPFPNRVEKFETRIARITRIELAKIREILVKGLCRRPPFDLPSFRAENF
jgi:hypothetical protein